MVAHPHLTTESEWLFEGIGFLVSGHRGRHMRQAEATARQNATLARLCSVLEFGKRPIAEASVRICAPCSNGTQFVYIVGATQSTVSWVCVCGRQKKSTPCLERPGDPGHYLNQLEGIQRMHLGQPVLA